MKATAVISTICICNIWILLYVLVFERGLFISDRPFVTTERRKEEQRSGSPSSLSASAWFNIYNITDLWLFLSAHMMFLKTL